MPNIPAKEVDVMLSGKLIKLLDLLQQKHLPKTRLVPDHNQKGFGLNAVTAASGGVLKRVDQAKSGQSWSRIAWSDLCEVEWFGPAVAATGAIADWWLWERKVSFMLVLSRKINESVMVGGNDRCERTLKVTVLEIDGTRVRLGFEVDADVPVHRFEVWERIHAGPRDATSLDGESMSVGFWRTESSFAKTLLIWSVVKAHLGNSLKAPNLF
jgi:carbon storage regulator